MYFVANWKMFGDLGTLNTLNKVITFVNKIKKNKFKLIYCPPSTLIYPLAKMLKKTSIEIGAQNCHESENNGAHTGQLNSMMLKDVGAKYVILGHSENRQSGENDRLINLKIRSAIKSGLKVIFCIGESLNDKRKRKAPDPGCGVFAGIQMGYQIGLQFSLGSEPNKNSHSALRLAKTAVKVLHSHDFFLSPPR